jgi:hypothetical protein
MEVALPYASWDTVSMKWIPNLRKGQNRYETCAEYETYDKNEDQDQVPPGSDHPCCGAS